MYKRLCEKKHGILTIHSLMSITSRQPRTKHTKYKSKPGPKHGKREQKAKTSAQVIARKNLTCADWLEIFEFKDQHPNLSQHEITNFFSSRRNRALFFTQSSLCRNLARRHVLEERANVNPTGLSSKRPRAVTHPDVESALILWQQSMEAKNELVSGPMLIAKRARFEEAFGIPEHERLQSSGWVHPFMKT